MTLRTLLLGMGMVFLVVQSEAQQDQVMSAISTQLELLVDTYVSGGLPAQEFSQDTVGLLKLFQPKANDTLHFENAKAVHLAELDLVQRDKGLNFRSSAAHNFLGSIIEEDGSFYDWRANAGLDWNLLRDGLVSHKHKAKQKELQWDAERYVFDQDMRDLSYRKTFDYIIYTFNSRKVKLIEKRLALLGALTEVASKMFYLKFMQWEEVLDFLSKKKETELFLNNFETYIDAVQLAPEYEQLQITNLPIFDIDFDEVEKQGVDTLARFVSLENKLKALDHQYHWSKDFNLNTQLRYSYYQGGLNSFYQGRDFLTGGISVGFPIPFNRHSTKRLVEAKRVDLKSKYVSFNEGLQNELLTHFYEYQYTLKQFVHFFYKKERLSVLIDRSMTQKHLEDPNYSPMHVVDKLDELFSVDLEILDIQQNLYLKALKIFNIIGVEEVLKFIKIQDYSSDAQKFVFGTSIHCKQMDFVDLDINFLIEYLDYNEIGELLISSTIEPSVYLKYAELLDLAQSFGAELNVRLSLSPEQMTIDGLENLKEQASYSLTPNIHLDFTGFDLAHSQVDTALNKHIISVFTDLSVKFNVSVSLPLTGTEVLRKSLYPHISKLHIVPERSEDLVGLFYLMTGQTGEPFEKVRLTVNAADFNSKLEMESFIKELKEHLDITQVGISDVGDMLDLERKMVGWHEERGF